MREVLGHWISTLRSWYCALYEPDEVEKASRRERVKRTAWQIGSSIIAMVAVIGVFVSLEVSGVPGWVGLAILAWALLDLRLFGWGVERFDIVAPWQFRDAEAKEAQSDD